MSAASPARAPQRRETFSHEALMYSGDDGFVAGTSTFIRDALQEDAPVMVAVGARKIGMLRDELGADAAGVRFVDMAVIGGNPARIIPAWREFLDEYSAPGLPVRGIGEPIHAERTPAELIECQRHESLLNLAFADTPTFRLLCPYDTALGDDVLREARCSHPVLLGSEGEGPSVDYRGLEAVLAPFDVPLPPPAGDPDEVAFEGPTLAALRRYVAEQANAAGIDGLRRSDLILAVDEVATNSIRYGGGSGVLRLWRDGEMLVCEIRDAGQIDKPLAGRERPSLDQVGGWGLWLANQLCHLVQLRTFPEGNVVRLHMPVG